MGKFTGESVQPEPYRESVVNTIRGKSLLLSAETGRDVRTLCRMIDWLTAKLDEDDGDDAWSENGWRHRFDIPEEE